MPLSSSVGTAVPRTGSTTYGAIEVLDLPTGGLETVPVSIVQGMRDGPCVWLVANIHGSEITGTAVLHSVLGQLDPRQLRGTVVVVPTLNPAALRTSSRTAYYDQRDPNRSFPGARKETGEEYYPSVYEQVAATVFRYIRESADYLIDMHNAQLRSVPYTIRDRALYRSEAQRGEAEKLAQRLAGMIDAFGVLVINEDLPRAYVSKELHRSTAGAALNEARIPAFTAELGASRFVDERGYDSGVSGTLSVLRWAGLLEDGGQILKAPEIPYPVRSIDHPRAPRSGIVRYVAEPGQRVRPGDAIATLHDVWGRPIGDGVVRSEREGWLTGLSTGSLVYPHSSLATLAVRDDEPLVAPWPEG